MLNRALFLDRDGTIIEDRDYPRDPALVQPLPGAVQALAALAGTGWRLILISNQSGVGRGLITLRELDAVQARFMEIMQSGGAPITATYMCTHAPEERCECRKPAPWLIRQAARDHSIDIAASWMIGDRTADIFCGKNAGCRTIWLQNERFPVERDLPDFIADGWESIYRKLSCS